MRHFVRCEACEAYRENEILRKVLERASEERERKRVNWGQSKVFEAGLILVEKAMEKLWHNM